MTRVVVVLSLLVSLAILGSAQGPLTPFANLMGRTDENGWLIASAAGASGTTQGPLTPLANLQVRTDENGYLLVSVEGLPTDPGTASGSYITNGCQVSHMTGLTFRMSACDYVVAGTAYSAVEQTVTLEAADATNPRIDVLIVDTAELFTYVKGTAAASPSEPTVDPGTQVRLGLVTIPATASAPTVTTTAVYAENAGHAAEWNCTDSGSTMVCDATAGPRTGTVHMAGTSSTAGDYLQLEKGAAGTLDVTTVDRLRLFLQTQSGFSSSRGLRVQLLSSGVIRCTQITLVNGVYGISTAITSAYQQVVIPIEDFGCSGAVTINQVRIVKFGSGANVTFRVDDVDWQADGVTPVTDLLTRTQADGLYLKIASNLSDLSSASTARTNLAVPPNTLQYLLLAASADTTVERVFTAGNGLAATDAGAGSTYTLNAVRTLGITIDGGGSAITTGNKGCFPVRDGGTITSATTLADQSGSIVLDVWVDSYANYPPTVADTITASAKPTISSATKAQDTTLTGWTTSIADNATICYNVDSNATITRATLSLEIR